MKTKNRVLNTTLALVGVGMLGAATTGRAAITIFFEQVGADVHIRGSGTLALDHTASSQVQASGTYLSGAQGVLDWTGSGYVSTGGVVTPTSLTTNYGTGSFVDGTLNSVGIWGFWQDRVEFDASDVTGGSVATNVTEITWSPANNYTILSNRNLVDLGADNLQNALAWTATGTGDTISLQTGAAPIPEPTAVALLALGACGVLLQRRRGVAASCTR